MSIRKILFSLFLGTACGFINLNAVETTIIPFLSTAKYTGDKNTAQSAGLYSKFSSSLEAFEFEYEKRNFDFSSSTKNYSQDDLTFVYSSTLSSNFKFNSAFHYVTSSYAQSGHAQGYLFGIKYFEKNKLEVGANGVYAHFAESPYSSLSLQADPYIGYHFADYRSLMGHFFFKFNYYLIRSKILNSTISPFYNSYEFTLRHYKGNFSTFISFWTGKQFHALKDNGLSFYHLDEIYNGGFTFASRYALDASHGIKLSYIYDDFTEALTLHSSTMTKYLISADFKF